MDQAHWDNKTNVTKELVCYLISFFSFFPCGKIVLYVRKVSALEIDRKIFQGHWTCTVIQLPLGVSLDKCKLCLCTRTRKVS